MSETGRGVFQPMAGQPDLHGLKGSYLVLTYINIL